MQTKQCESCGLTKPVSEFYKQKLSSDGLNSVCKPCYQRTRREYYAASKQPDYWETKLAKPSWMKLPTLLLNDPVLLQFYTKEQIAEVELTYRKKQTQILHQAA